MKLFTRLWIIIVLVHCFSATFCQDIGFSQFYDQPLLRNPALAGIFTGDMRFTASYRNQWESVTVPYRTFGLSSEVKLPVHFINDDNLTFGLQMLRDIAGTSEFSTTQMLPAINLSIPVGANSFYSLAVMAGPVQQRFDQTKLVFNDQFVAGSNGNFSILPSSRQVFSKTDVNYVDLSFGLSLNGTIGNDIDYYVGGGVFHALEPNVAFFDAKEVKLNRKFTTNFGMYIPLNEDDNFIIYGDYFRQAKVNTFQCGFMYSRVLSFSDNDKVQTAITGGILYRMDDAIIPVIELHISKFTIGTSYDVNISKLAVASQYRGGVELTLSYTDLFGRNKTGDRQWRCPKFGQMPGGDFIGY
ncbi:MAG: PorP/SprF family type IX secretion system membrane protein [Ginsengibacter sp.]